MPILSQRQSTFVFVYFLVSFSVADNDDEGITYLYKNIIEMKKQKCYKILLFKKKKTNGEKILYPHSGTSLLTDISQNVKEDKELVSTVVLSIMYGIKLTENILWAFLLKLDLT